MLPDTNATSKTITQQAGDNVERRIAECTCALVSAAADHIVHQRIAYCDKETPAARDRGRIDERRFAIAYISMLYLFSLLL